MSQELWVGCFTEPDGRGGLHRFEVTSTGLTALDQTALASPGWLIDTGFGSYAVQELPESRLSALTDHGRTVAAGVPTHGRDACHGALNPAGTVVGVAHYSSGSAAFVPVSGPELGEATVLPFTGHSGVVPERQEAPHAHQCVWLDDTHALVCDLGADLVRVVRFAEGIAAEIGQIPTSPGFGPRHLVVRPAPDHSADNPGAVQFAVAGELNGEVASYAHSGLDWAKNWTLQSQVAGSRIGGAAPSGIRALGPTQLVMANRFIDTLAILDWDPTGVLSLRDEFDCGGNHPRDLVVHADQIWVANRESNDVCCLDRQGTLQSRTSIPSPGALLFR